MTKSIKWYWWIIILSFTFMVGYFSKIDDVKVVTQECNYSNWQTLKNLDDEIISTSTQGFTLSSQSMQFILDGNYAESLQKSSELSDLVPKVKSLSDQRHELLKKLGY